MSELVSIGPLVDSNDAFGVPDIESDDSLEAAITKESKKKKSFKYKMMMKGQRKGTKQEHVVEAEEEEEVEVEEQQEEEENDSSIPVLRPLYVTNYVQKYATAERMAPFRKFEHEEQIHPPQRKPQTDHNTSRTKKHTSSSQHKPKPNHTSSHRSPSPLPAERMAPFRKFEREESQNHPPQNHRKHAEDRHKQHTVSRPSPLTVDPISELRENKQEEEQSLTKRSNKYSSRLAKISPHPSYDTNTKTANSVNKSNGSGSNKYSLTLSRHRRTVQLEKEEKEREQKAASLHAQLLADGEFYLRAPSNTSTQYFSALSHSFQNSRTGFSLESTSKRSHMSSSLASSIDVGASPDEILAFGSVVDHLTKGGSIMNANKIFQKELRMLGKYRDEDPIEATYHKAERKLKKKAYECDEESIEVLHDDDGGDDTVVHTVDDTVHDSDAIELQDVDDEDSVSTFKFDKYLAKFVEPEDDDLTFEDEGDGDEDEQDWCVPDPTDHEDEAGALSEDAGDSYTNDHSLETGDEYTTDSSCDTGSYESDSDSEAFTFEDDDSSSFQCDSTITSYVSTSSLIKKSKRNKSKTKKQKNKKKKDKKKKNKKEKRNFLSILKGKKRSKEKHLVEVHSEETKVDGSNVLQVDRLPDSFEDDNDENTNIGNHDSNPKREPKRNDRAIARATAEKNQRITTESAIREVVNYALELAANQVSDDETEESESKRTEGGSLEQPSLESIRILEEIPFGPPSLETGTVSSKSLTTSSLKTMELLKDAAAKKDDKGVLLEALAEAGCADPEAMPTIGSLVLVDTADALFLKDALGLPGTACFDKTPLEEDSNPDDGENNSICGASLSMESITSLDASSVIGSFIEDAAQFTNDSIRSAKSIFFPDDDVGDELGMTAADDFEEQLKSMEDPEDSKVPTSTTTTTTEEPRKSLEKAPAKPFVPEYADCDEGLEDDTVGASARKTPKGTTPTTPSSLSTNKTKKPKVKRRRSFFKRSASSERGKLSKEAPTDEEESDYEVDIVVYSRDKLPADTVGLSESTFVNPKPLMDDPVGLSESTFVNPKPLMDDTDEGDAPEEPHEEQQPPPPTTTATATATASNSMTAHDLMAAEYAQTSSEEVLTELLHKAAGCCGGVAATGNDMVERGHQMMETLPLDKIAAMTAQAPGAAEAMVANLLKATTQQEGPIVSSSHTTTTNEATDEDAAMAGFSIAEILSTEELPIEWVLSEEEKKERRKRSLFGRKKK